MFDNRKVLRKLIQAALQKQGYAIRLVKPSGARLQITRDGKTAYTLARTSSDRWLGWMRSGDDWRGLKEADLVVVGALKKDKADVADVFAFAPTDLREAFRNNLAARQSKNPRLKESAPVFVCLDDQPNKYPWAVSSNLKAKALWRVELPLEPVGSDKELSQTRSSEAQESFAIRVRQEFADLVGVPVEKVNVDFRVSL